MSQNRIWSEPSQWVVVLMMLSYSSSALYELLPKGLLPCNDSRQDLKLDNPKNLFKCAILKLLSLYYFYASDIRMYFLTSYDFCQSVYALVHLSKILISVTCQKWVDAELYNLWWYCNQQLNRLDLMLQKGQISEMFFLQ